MVHMLWFWISIASSFLGQLWRLCHQQNKIDVRGFLTQAGILCSIFVPRLIGSD